MRAGHPTSRQLYSSLSFSSISSAAVFPLDAPTSPPSPPLAASSFPLAKHSQVILSSVLLCLSPAQPYLYFPSSRIASHSIPPPSNNRHHRLRTLLLRSFR